MSHTPNQKSAAAFLAQLLDNPPPWLPETSSWEIFREDDGRHSLNGVIIPGPPPASDLLRTAAHVNAGSYEEGLVPQARFILDGHPITLYHLAPPAHRPASSCTACGTSLEAPGVPLVWIGLVPRAICVPCRDRMHHAFLEANKPRRNPTRSRS
ncbi:hypothetical protein [Streptomyces sp. NPDC051183]|uniref:hypothetical protein n=1 Tax=Streptomyces sp. NPDC051183 TaxID=3155165 RepID=UPI00343BC60E